MGNVPGRVWPFNLDPRMKMMWGRVKASWWWIGSVIHLCYEGQFRLTPWHDLAHPVWLSMWVTVDTHTCMETYFSQVHGLLPGAPGFIISPLPPPPYNQCCIFTFSASPFLIPTTSTLVWATHCCPSSPFPIKPFSLSSQKKQSPLGAFLEELLQDPI